MDELDYSAHASHMNWRPTGGTPQPRSFRGHQSRPVDAGLVFEGEYKYQGRPDKMPDLRDFEVPPPRIKSEGRALGLPSQGLLPPGWRRQNALQPHPPSSRSYTAATSTGMPLSGRSSSRSAAAHHSASRGPRRRRWDGTIHCCKNDELICGLRPPPSLQAAESDMRMAEYRARRSREKRTGLLEPTPPSPSRQGLELRPAPPPPSSPSAVRRKPWDGTLVRRRHSQDVAGPPPPVKLGRPTAGIPLVKVVQQAIGLREPMRVKRRREQLRRDIARRWRRLQRIVAAAGAAGADVASQRVLTPRPPPASPTAAATATPSTLLAPLPSPPMRPGRAMVGLGPRQPRRNPPDKEEECREVVELPPLPGVRPRTASSQSSV
eukprot:TRINITY_DN19050_c0_g1_i1.p1 TRINITY_DN19050_c0_g1~~TRINITY_DN19050_c0_g1_i1.p1  ORF type:complete len:378 (+),score=85.43 TRINITY_DN19050_c0_g1_i1:86-1219(+)